MPEKSFENHAVRWILEVHDCVTKSNPNITVGQVMEIFRVQGSFLDFLYDEYNKFSKPPSKRYQQICVATEEFMNTNPV